MRRIAFVLLLLASAVASAGILPLLRDRPRRDNAYDPTNKPMSLPLAPAWTSTPTATATPACGSADHATGGGTISVGTFESTNDGFGQDTCCANFLTFSPALSAVHCNGNQAYCGTANFTHAGQPKQIVYKKSIGPAQNWSGKALHCWVRFDPGMDLMSAQLYIKSNGFVYSNGPAYHGAAAGGWSLLSFDLTATPNFQGGVTNTATVSEVGMQIYSNASDPDGTYSFCLDDVYVQ